MEQDPVNTPPGLERIKRIVVVMFENRSFDHIFGAFPGVNGLFGPDGQINENYYNLANPTAPPSPANPACCPSPIDPSKPLEHDFTHDFGDGMMPDLFGPTFTISPDGSTYTSGYVKGAPVGQVQPVPQTYPATNSGFYTTHNYNQPQEAQALTYFAEGALQILPALAKNFVLCDNWHCDMPGHTLVNRAFFHCAATGDVGIDDPDSGICGIPSLFDLIGNSAPGGASWKMYAPAATDKNDDVVYGHLDTRFLNSKLQSYPGCPITDFAADCQNGELPFYSFLMCWMPQGLSTAYTDTSMHPASMVQAGENYLAAIYNTLRNSPCWEDTLLVVTFDENGGIYDHVFPPQATPPDPTALPKTQGVKGSCGNRWILDSTFDFSLLGFRIPALLISPWLAAGVDSQQYQNTSVLRFVIDRMNAEYGTKAGPLTQRDATAPQLASAFAQFGQREMRQDCPGWIAPYATLPSTDPSTGSNAIPYSDGKLTVWNPPPTTSEAAPVRYSQELLDTYVASLPGHADSGGKITRTFDTNADVGAYVKERLQAAQA